ncbi:unnamed protein product [Gongylonema pulchrum]|uniref:Ovule protein n=1 Tax=Gongylonema pulchrum TaxID=637853 RepID=A0A183E270_9BILA|nr:unnamed protein product [Gongylonema pulchrum]
MKEECHGVEESERPEGGNNKHSVKSNMYALKTSSAFVEMYRLSRCIKLSIAHSNKVAVIKRTQHNAAP